MNKGDITRMAREAGFEFNSLGATYTSGCLPDLLDRFAALAYSAGVADEREACAEVCEDQIQWGEINKTIAIAAGNCADLIRARGQE